MWEKFHRGEQRVAGHEMENLLRKHGQHLDHNDVSRYRTHVLLTTRHVTYTGSLGGTCGNSSQCGRV